MTPALAKLPLIVLILLTPLEGQDTSPSRKEKDRILIELSESPRVQFGRIDYLKQSRPQQVFTAIWELEGQVNNGGFHQWFFNSSGDIAVYTEDALRAIGAARTADIVAAAVALFPGGPPPRNRAERQRRLATVSPNVLEAWDRLDGRFFKAPDDLTSLLYSWVKAHPKEFGSVR